MDIPRIYDQSVCEPLIALFLSLHSSRPKLCILCVIVSYSYGPVMDTNFVIPLTVDKTLVVFDFYTELDMNSSEGNSFVFYFR
jgi:hypothetical protein